ncbi:MAG: hypothetical protein H6Q70_99 [Firmicutes bacterium]|nr:hypothetical protein [Bacillota bacterium]
MKKRNLRRRRIKKTIRKYWTVAEWIPFWYETYKESKHALTTQQVQKTYIYCHIIPYLGNMYMHKVETHHVQNFINYLFKEGNKSKLKNSKNVGKPLSSWTVKKIRSLLSTCFERAIKEHIILYNPVKETESIPVQTLKVAYFSENQENIFLENTKRHRFHAAYQLLFSTGCRRSEILGLTWDEIDFERDQISIQKVLVSVNGVPILKDYPKTTKSVRTIPVHPDILKMLKEHLKKQKAEIKADPNYQRNNLVFCNIDGSPHSPNYFLHNFKAAIRRLGLPNKLRVHSTRHTFATNLLQLGTSISDVQQLGGWSDTRVVLDIYSHSVRESQKTAIKKLFDKNNKNKNRKT